MEGDSTQFMKFKFGEARPGFSGAPLLNRRTGAVCGVMVLTRGESTLMGGRGIPTSVVLEQFKELVTLQKEFHSKDRQWYDLLPESEVKQFSWQELRAICSKITEKRMLSTIRDKYSEELYLQRDHAHQAFMRFLQDPTKRGFVLVGGSGVGKSNFLLSVHEELQARERVCVLIYDAGSPMEHPLMETINEDFHEQVGWTTQRLWEKIKSIDGIDKRLVLFCVDALNEHEQPRPLLKQLNELIQRPWPWLKVVIVSRPEAWQSIKRGVKLAETLYYREEDEAPGAILESFNYSERLEPFSRRELPLVYARYQRKYEVRTLYEDLSSRLRDIISDPFNLLLVARAYRTKAIPEHLKATTLIEEYLSALIKQGERLQGGDPDWLENQLVPLMVSEGHYERVITSEELDTTDHALYRALLDRADSSGLPQHQSFTNLVDAEILKREPRGIGFTIAFKSERFYDFFVGRRLFDMSEAQADRHAYFLDMIGRTTEHPYLWGAVRNALVQEAEQQDIEIVLKLCRTPDQHVREMMVNILTTLGADAPRQVEHILKELVPAARRATTIKKVRQWQGKTPIDTGRPTRNAGRIATEVASNLNLPWLLQAAALQEDSTIRTEAVRFSYHLWKRDHQAGFTILEHLTQETISGLIPEKAALESTIGLSTSIFFDSYQDEQVLRRLQGFWHDIVARMLAGEQGKLWERILRHLFFPPGRIFSTVIDLVIGYIDRLPDYGEAFNYPALEAFFHLGATEKALYARLVSYIDVEGNYSREQMKHDYLAVMRQTNNYLIVFMVQLGLIAHACQDPFAFLPFLQRFYEETKKDIVAYPYMNDVIHVLDNVLHRGTMDDALFNFFVFAVQECQEFYIRHPEAIRNRHYSTKPEAHDLGPYIFHVYRKTGSVKTAWLETRIQSALARGDTRFFELLLMSELSLIGIERQSPKAALLTVAMFFQQLKGNAAIRAKTQEFLAHLRAYYPNEVDGFLEEQEADNDFRVQVQIHEPEEDIATLIGQRSLYFLRDGIIMQSPTLRSRLLSLLTQAAECRSIRVWLDYFLREVINLLYGGEILHVPE